MMVMLLRADNLLHAFCVELWPVRNTAIQASYMYEVEALLPVCPLIASVVDLKLQIRRNLVWLFR